MRSRECGRDVHPSSALGTNGTGLSKGRKDPVEKEGTELGSEGTDEVGTTARCSRRRAVCYTVGLPLLVQRTWGGSVASYGWLVALYGLSWKP